MSFTLLLSSLPHLKPLERNWAEMLNLTSRGSGSCDWNNSSTFSAVRLSKCVLRKFSSPNPNSALSTVGDETGVTAGEHVSDSSEGGKRQRYMRCCSTVSAHTLSCCSTEREETSSCEQDVIDKQQKLPEHGHLQNFLVQSPTLCQLWPTTMVVFVAFSIQSRKIYCMKTSGVHSNREGTS